MIIKQDIQVKDRRTLKLVKAYARERRDEHYESLTRSSEAFRQKWTVERFAQVIGMKMIPSMIGEKLAALAAGPSREDQKGETKEAPLWRELLGEFLENFIPRLVRRMV